MDSVDKSVVGIDVPSITALPMVNDPLCWPPPLVGLTLVQSRPSRTTAPPPRLIEAMSELAPASSTPFTTPDQALECMPETEMASVGSASGPP
ncbi:MAG TPA: hypothetical protein VK428_14950 [Acidimicrobiales bacterium]|nr:hypothetical protein [Acidimicrobiales bacterium]